MDCWVALNLDASPEQRKTTNLVQDVLRQFYVLQFCHVHGHDLATGSDGEGAGADCPFVCFSVVTRVSVCLSRSLSLAGRCHN